MRGNLVGETQPPMIPQVYVVYMTQEGVFLLLYVASHPLSGVDYTELV